MKNNFYTWNITERYAESLQNLARSKELSQVDSSFHLKCNFANKFVLLNKLFLSLKISVNDILMEQVRGVEVLENAVKFISLEDVKLSFDDAFDGVMTLYQNKLIQLFQVKSLEVHDHLHKITTDSELTKIRKCRIYEFIRTIKLHPVLTDGVIGNVVTEPTLTSLNLVDYHILELNVRKFLTLTKDLLSLTSKDLLELGVATKIKKSFEDTLIRLLLILFTSNKNLKEHEYIIEDSEGHIYRLKSSLSLKTLRNGLTDAWYSKEGDLLDVTVKLSRIRKMEVYKGVIYVNSFNQG